MTIKKTTLFILLNALQVLVCIALADKLNSGSTMLVSPTTSSPRGVVYSRVPRTVYSNITKNNFTKERTTIDGVSYKNFDIYDQLSETGDVADVLQEFNGPGQLVFLDNEGNSHILFDCMASKVPCVPLDGMVNFSGDKVIFSVYYGTLDFFHEHDMELPNQVLLTSHAQLHTVDLNTFKVTPIPQPKDVYDTGPVWLPNGRIMFTSTRSKEFGTTIREHSPVETHSLQLWISNADGSNPRNVSPHERDQALHPYVLSSGRVIYSTWQLSHQLPFRENNGDANSFGTTRNFFWVASVDLRGGDWHSLLGAHGGYINNDGEEMLQGAHFLGERANGDICTTSYYRGGNFGSGSILCWTPEELGVEGWGPAEVRGTSYDDGERIVFSPRNLYSAFPFAKGNDDASQLDKRTGKYLGKVRDPDGLPDGNLLFSYGSGRCSSAYDNVFDVQEDEVVCNFGIYKTDALRPMKSGELASHPSEFVKIVDDPAWHEYMPRLVAPFEEIYGIKKPKEPRLTNSGSQNKCLLGSKSMQMHGNKGGDKPHLSEIESFSGWSFGNYRICGNQGCSMHGVNPASEIEKIRFWKIHPLLLAPGNTPDFNQVQSIFGSRASILGDVDIEDDGSFLVQLPCDMPYVMAGVDKQGRVIARDQVVQSIRPGEKRICEGCHLHSKTLDFKFEETQAAKKDPVVLLEANAKELEYKKDIQVLLNSKCSSCHNSSKKAGGLALNVPGKQLGSTYHTLVWNYSNELQRPETSKYVNGAFARESLLYWKAAGERTDGRSDDDYHDDIDFGAEHPSFLSQEELSILGSWLDSGAYYK